MAQQTINVGAAPNDGTGTPLRTAFQYTNSNFSELYTATGPSGNNITVPGTATITGDLTVDTSTLKVDSANNRVGIGTASPAATLIVRDGANRNLLVSSDAAQLGSAGIAIGSFTDNAAGYAPLSIIAGTSMAFGMNGSTAMTLNSTGLGVGSSPLGTAAGRGNVTINGSTDAILALGNAGVLTGYVAQSTLGMDIVGVGATFVRIQTNGNARLLVDSAGNFIPTLQATVPSLGLNSQMVFNLTSNTNLRISVRGSDGVTRTTNLTLT